MPLPIAGQDPAGSGVQDRGRAPVPDLQPDGRGPAGLRGGRLRARGARMGALLKVPSLPPEVARVVAPLLADAQRQRGGPRRAPRMLQLAALSRNRRRRRRAAAPRRRAPTTVSGTVIGGGAIGPGGAVLWLSVWTVPRRRRAVAQAAGVQPVRQGVRPPRSGDRRRRDRGLSQRRSLLSQRVFAEPRAALRRRPLRRRRSYQQTFTRPGPVELLATSTRRWSATSTSSTPRTTPSRARRALHHPQRAAWSLRLNAWHESSAASSSRPSPSAPDGASGIVVRIPGDRPPMVIVPDKYGNPANASSDIDHVDRANNTVQARPSGLTIAAVVLRCPTDRSRGDADAAAAGRRGGGTQGARAAELAREALARADGGGGDDDRKRPRQPAFPRGAARPGRPRHVRRPARDRILVGAVPGSPDRHLLRRRDAGVRADRGRRRRAGRPDRARGGGRPGSRQRRDGGRAAGRSSSPPGRCRSGRDAPRCCCWPSGSTARCWRRWRADRGGRCCSATGCGALARGGTDSALLEPLVGREASGDVALPEPAAHAAAVEIAPGLSLWVLGRAAEFEHAAVAADRSRRQVVCGRWRFRSRSLIAAVSLRRRRGEPAARPSC